MDFVSMQYKIMDFVLMKYKCEDQRKAAFIILQHKHVY
jgi:hypothetical protein